MTKKIFIFEESKNRVISVLDYETGVESNLTSSTIPFKVLDITDDQYWYGDYSTGGLRSINTHPLIDQVVVDTITNKEILARYPVHSQLNIIADCMEKAGIPLTPEFVEMRAWIKQKVKNYNDSVEVYSSNTNTYSWVPKPTIPTE